MHTKYFDSTVEMPPGQPVKCPVWCMRGQTAQSIRADVRDVGRRVRTALAGVRH